ATPALVDDGGHRIELSASAQWPAAVLVGPTGALAGAVYFERLRVMDASSASFDFPRLDLFDAAGVRRVILRMNLPAKKGDRVLLILLDRSGQPRLRLGDTRVELLDAAGNVVSTWPVEGPPPGTFAGLTL